MAAEQKPVMLAGKNAEAITKILQGGVYLVTVHNGQIVQIARVERPLSLG